MVFARLELTPGIMRMECCTLFWRNDRSVGVGVVFYVRQIYLPENLGTLKIEHNVEHLDVV